jgi:hypothetical protein
MQIVNKTIQCSECGCISFPDAKYCPKCGTGYKDNEIKQEMKDLFRNISLLTIQGPTDTERTIIKAYYQLICPSHGQVDVNTALVVPVMKCPLCRGS